MVRRSSTVGGRAALRVVAAALVLAFSAAGTARVFDRSPVVFVAAAVILPTAVVLTAAGARWRAGLHLVAVALAVVLSVVIAGGRAGRDTVDGLTKGWSLAVSTDWPSPLRPELVAFFTFVVAAAAVATAELARPPRWRAVPLIPSVLLGVLVLVLAAPDGPPNGVTIGLWTIGVATVLALGDAGLPHASPREEVRGEGRAIAMVVALAVAAAVLVSVSVVNDRYDPRVASANPLVERDSLNPLSQVLAERAEPEPRVVFTVEGDLADRWRTRVLDVYDGVSWSSSLTVRPVAAGRLDTRAAAELHQVLTIGSQALAWVPVPGRPLAVDADVASDQDRSVLVADEPLAAGRRVEITFAESARLAELSPESTSEREPDDQAAPLTTLAESLAGEGTLVERLGALEAALRDDYLLARDAPAGTNIGLLEYTLRSSRQGTAEQYVSMFVLMARTLGARARLAVGYVVPTSGREVTTADAAAWAEVWFAGVGWVAYDPIPTRTATDAPPGRQPVGATPAEIPLQPPTPPPPPERETATDPVVSEPTRDGPLARVLFLGGGGLLGLLALVGAVAGTVIAVKRRRRRRRLRAAEPYQRVLGAWAEATDSLVDLGARFLPFQTNGEMASAGSGLLSPRGRVPLADLAGLANQAAHGAARPDDLIAAHAVRLLGQIEQEADERITRRRRWRARLSVRSLRRTTRSPAG